MGINPRVLASVTSETPGFRGEGCELSQEKQKLAAHIYWLMKSAARSLQLHSKLFRDEEPKVGEGKTRSL